MDRSSRAARLADQIRDYLALWLNRDFPGALVSVGSVQLSTSGHQATVWLRFLATTERSPLKNIVQKTSYYQFQLRQSLNRAAVPAISFRLEPPEVENESLI